MSLQTNAVRLSPNKHHTNLDRLMPVCGMITDDAEQQSQQSTLLLIGEIELLQRMKEFNNNAASGVEKFLLNHNFHTLVMEYDENLKKRDVDMGFNLFSIISEVYHRENFHSDIIGALIDPKGKHREQEIFLQLFLKFIHSDGAKINLLDYSNVLIEREIGRIDLCIKDQNTKKAIIIENKINNAGDMRRQIPRYLEYVRAKGYTCDAIIYLRLNGNAGPDRTGWTDDERKDVDAILTIICAYDETEWDLLHGWIFKCEKLARERDTQHILRQYGDLLKKLGGNVMNKPVMDKFYKTILEGENFKTAMSLRAMLDDLVLYRVERIIHIFRHDLTPFDSIRNWDDCDAYFTGFIWEKAAFGLDIWVDPELYLFEFWDRNDGEGKNGKAKAILEKMGCLVDYTFGDGRFRKEFVFPSQEADLIQHIKAFKLRLHEVASG